MSSKKIISKLLSTFLILIPYPLSLTSIFLSGCATTQMPEYISKVDHPYDRKYYASYERVTSAVVYVLKNQGWTINSEADPSIYERDDRYDNDGYHNILIITNIKKKFGVFYSTYTQLNVLVHSLANTCDVEIRYQSKKPLVKEFVSTRNDQLVENILDDVEQEIGK